MFNISYPSFIWGEKLCNVPSHLLPGLAPTSPHLFVFLLSLQFVILSTEEIMEPMSDPLFLPILLQGEISSLVLYAPFHGDGCLHLRAVSSPLSQVPIPWNTLVPLGSRPPCPVPPLSTPDSRAPRTQNNSSSISPASTHSNHFCPEEPSRKLGRYKG